jgi:hypothetical protein
LFCSDDQTRWKRSIFGGGQIACLIVTLSRR